ncbi:CDK5 regulatory subunit associated protein [Trichuris trichiura]|uniref:CDK5 regulatory subunit associated protein n=1 Tax=Trichuris trichiura TaxID=36087 RepID=A0A077Z4S6_TRITR|nr:CDK5 regulatory subunit associated protein [Trichuris trichiura]
MADYKTIPIDIHCFKLLDWLQSRRHCKRDWSQYIAKIRPLISDAMKDMPENDSIATLLSDTPLVTYFECAKIVELLKETEASSKNIFGSYTSQRMKDWQSILQQYEKDSVYLAESAHILTEYAQYEIPALKKQIAKLEELCQVSFFFFSGCFFIKSIFKDCERKERDCELQIRDSSVLFRKECQTYGIEGVNVPSELLRLADDLPKSQDKIVHKLASHLALLEFYGEFTESVLGRPLTNEEKKGSLKMFRFLVNHGNVSFYEWKHGKPPTAVVPPVSITDLQLAENDANDDTIDFGDDLVLADSADTVNFGIEEISSGEQGKSSPAQEIPKQPDTVARGSDALSLLDNRTSFRLLMSDLLELKAFLKMRLTELDSDDSSSHLVLIDDGINESSIDKVQIQKWAQGIDDIIADVNDPVLAHLSELKSSSGYLEELTKKICSHNVRADRARQTIAALKQRHAELCEQIVALREKVTACSRIVKKLQAEIEAEISRRYPGRQVNIIGSVLAV